MTLVSFLAQAGGAPAGGGAFSILLLIAPIAVLYYFMLIRPQQKQQKKHKEMLGALKRGDTVVTTSGFIGKVAKIEDDEVLLELAEGVKARILKPMIHDVRAKPQPEKGSDKSASKVAKD